MWGEVAADVFGVLAAGGVGEVAFAGEPLVEPFGDGGLTDQPGTGLQGAADGVGVGEVSVGGDGVFDQVAEFDAAGGVAAVGDGQQGVEVQQGGGGVVLVEVAGVAQGASGAVGAAG